MKCQFCMEEIADNSEKCAHCNSELVKPCPFCLENILVGALKCKHCGSMLNVVQPQQQVQPPIQQQQPPIQQQQPPIQQQQPPIQQQQPPIQQQQPPIMQKSMKPLPPEAAGWCWGGFFLTWIWAIGNSTWIGLLALVPLVNIVMMFVLGAKGREWAWKNKQWQGVDHFNSVQNKWTVVGVILFAIGVVGITVAVAIPQFNAYRIKGYNSAAMSDLKNAKTSLEAYLVDHQRYPESLEAAKYIPSKNVYIKCSMLPDSYVCAAAHKQGNVLYVTDSAEGEISKLTYISGDAIQIPYEPRPMGSAKADQYLQNDPSAGLSQSDVHQQFSYYQPVTLSGVLKSGIGIDANDKKVIYPSLQLSSPITVNGNPNDDDEGRRLTETDVAGIQLVIDGDLMSKYNSLKGKNVTVSCSDLFRQINGNHFTKILCTATEIKSGY